MSPLLGSWNPTELKHGIRCYHGNTWGHLIVLLDRLTCSIYENESHVPFKVKTYCKCGKLDCCLKLPVVYMQKYEILQDVLNTYIQQQKYCSL